MVHATQEVHHTHGCIKIGQIVNIIYVQTPGILFHGINDSNCLEEFMTLEENQHFNSKLIFKA